MKMACGDPSRRLPVRLARSRPDRDRAPPRDRDGGLRRDCPCRRNGGHRQSGRHVVDLTRTKPGVCSPTRSSACCCIPLTPRPRSHAPRIAPRGRRQSNSRCSAPPTRARIPSPQIRRHARARTGDPAAHRRALEWLRRAGSLQRAARIAATPCARRGRRRGARPSPGRSGEQPAGCRSRCATSASKPSCLPELAAQAARAMDRHVQPPAVRRCGRAGNLQRCVLVIHVNCHLPTPNVLA